MSLQRMPLIATLDKVTRERGYELRPVTRHGYQLSRKGHVLLSNALLSEVCEWLLIEWNLYLGDTRGMAACAPPTMPSPDNKSIIGGKAMTKAVGCINNHSPRSATPMPHHCGALVPPTPAAFRRGVPAT